MPNMSHCRFHNTLSDLRDCQEALDNGELDNGDLSQEEERAAHALVDLCSQIHYNHGAEE